MPKDKQGWPADKVKRRKVDSLIEFARNARLHSDDQIRKIANSMVDNGRWEFCVENDCYAVTESGAVYRVCRRQRSKAGRIISAYETVLLHGSTDKYGYRVYRMLVDGKKKHVKGHRLVLNAFKGEQPEMVANHDDGDKQNNSICNLGWATVAENNEHAINTGLLKPHQPNWKIAKVHRSAYVAIHALHKHFGVSRTQIAARCGVCRQTIDRVVNIVSATLDDILVDLDRNASD